MANLAIRGHETRGKEVIEILEMLGGKNKNNLDGKFKSAAYIISSFYFGEIAYTYCYTDVYNIFTLEEFLENFPYKVGHFVHVPEYESKVCICNMRWSSLYNYMEYMVYRDGMPEWYTAKALLDYNDDFLVDKETNMNEDNNQETLETKTTEGVIVCNEFCDCYNPKDDVYRNNTTEKIPLEQSKQCKDIDDVRHVNSITDDIMINQITSKVSVIKFNPDVCDNEIELQLGNYKIEVRDGKTYAVKNKPKYPKTYKECCEVLGITNDNHILAFPTEEMRDAFYENFKGLIESCKELL